MRLGLDDPERYASGCGAIVSGVGSAWGFAAEAVELLFGVPVQVVLACFASSATARTYIGSAGLIKTAGIILAFTALGAWTVPLVLHLFGWPTSVQAGVGVLISGGVQLPVVRDWLVEIVKAVFSRKAGGAPPTNGGPP